MRPTPRVKVCGLRSLENAIACHEAGAELLGINFFPKSKRFVDFAEARAWLGDLEGLVERVGLFVNASIEHVRSIARSGLIDTVQLHGDESLDFARQLTDAGIPLIRAIRVRGLESLRQIRSQHTRRILLDAHSAKGYGGTGETFDWELARKAVTDHPDLEIMLSGGLSPANVADAVKAVRPAAVDVASGVESAPGIKDPELVRTFADHARSA